jgi:hypothetical protein
MEQFTQLGIAGATLFILFLVVRFFIATIEKKDAQIQAITDKFSDTVNTHLANENIAREQEREALTRVINVLDEHTKVLGNIVTYNTNILNGMEKLSKDASKIRYGRRKGDKPLIHA